MDNFPINKTVFITQPSLASHRTAAYLLGTGGIQRTSNDSLQARKVR